MNEKIDNTLKDISARFSDRRTQLLDVKRTGFDNRQLQLAGRVLDEPTCRTLIYCFQEQFPEVQLETSGVRVMRTPSSCMAYVKTNLTGIYDGASWLAEMLSQNTYGSPLEILEDQGNWVFVRQSDGYLGWMYRPYLTEIPSPSPTHIVSAPVTQLYAEPNTQSTLRSRLVGGTFVQIVSTRGAWAEIDANNWGWVLLSDLRALDLLAQTADARRKQIIGDAIRLVGVPYLWGGTSN